MARWSRDGGSARGEGALPLGREARPDPVRHSDPSTIGCRSTGGGLRGRLINETPPYSHDKDDNSNNSSNNNNNKTTKKEDGHAKPALDGDKTGPGADVIGVMTSSRPLIRRSSRVDSSVRYSSLTSAARFSADSLELGREGCLDRYTSCRWVLGYVCCLARFAQSAVRQCIGMAVVCMTLHSSVPTLRSASSPNLTSPGAGLEVLFSNSSAGNQSSEEVVKAEFVWSPEYEGLILNAFNIGFFFSPIIGGHIAGTYGGKCVMLVALLAGAVTTICLPLAAKANDIFVMVLRILTGLSLGVVDPCIQALWAKWAPKGEKAQLTTCSYTGLSLAGIVTFFIAGHLCDIDLENGWPFIFYFFGGLTLLVCLPWAALVYDSPDKHPRISDYEQMLIAVGTNPSKDKQKMKTPWKRMVTSGPFWAIVVAHVTYTWVTSWMMAYLPKYLRDRLKFEVKENGLYSSLPYVGRMLSGFLSAFLSDKLQQRGVLSTGGCRKLFQFVGCLGCAACTLAVGFLDSDTRGAAVALLVLAMSFQNVTSVAFRINHIDIAPRFAGVMMGMTVTVAMAVSLTGPPITAAIIRNGTHEEWLTVFAIVASLNVIGAIVFCLLGSGNVQEWAEPPAAAPDTEVAPSAGPTAGLTSQLSLVFFHDDSISSDAEAKEGDSSGSKPAGLVSPWADGANPLPQQLLATLSAEDPNGHLAADQRVKIQGGRARETNNPPGLTTSAEQGNNWFSISNETFEAVPDSKPAHYRHNNSQAVKDSEEEKLTTDSYWTKF